MQINLRPYIHKIHWFRGIRNKYWSQGNSESLVRSISYFRICIILTVYQNHFIGLLYNHNCFITFWKDCSTVLIMFYCIVLLDTIYEKTFFLKWRNTGKVYRLFFGTFILALTKSLIWEEDWALVYNSMYFLDSKVSKISRPSLVGVSNYWT